jgi:hypothetical protein
MGNAYLGHRLACRFGFERGQRPRSTPAVPHDDRLDSHAAPSSFVKIGAADDKLGNDGHSISRTWRGVYPVNPVYLISYDKSVTRQIEHWRS